VQPQSGGSANESQCVPAMSHAETAQVSLALEGQPASHGLTAMDGDDGVLTALARELVTQRGI
jgi:hypothetical protein